MTERLKNRQFSCSNYRQTTAGRLVSSIVNLKVILKEVICNDVFKSNNAGKMLQQFETMTKQCRNAVLPLKRRCQLSSITSF